MTKGPIIFRVNAGARYGFGHLSRCMNLAEEFATDTSTQFIIRTDDRENVASYIEKRISQRFTIDYEFIATNFCGAKEFDYFKHHAIEKKAFFVIDHYEANAQYQKKLAEIGVRWLQFDSHGWGPFYSNAVLHASPAATEENYRSLLKNKEALLLLGTKFAVLNKSFWAHHEKVSPRTKLAHVFLSFGGGDTKEIIPQLLSLLSGQWLRSVTMDILIGKKNSYIEEIRDWVDLYPQITLHIGENNVIPFMKKADLAIISPGTLSYEAACLGLPMVLVPFVDNQLMNAKGWSQIGCAVSTKEINDLRTEEINSLLIDLSNRHNQILDMSTKCLEAVDGKGAKRVKQAIDKIL